jgi:hypothetical protein
MDRTVRGSNHGEGEIFRTRPARLGTHRFTCTMGAVSFWEAKRQERGADRSLQSKAEGANGLPLYFRPLCACINMSWVSFTFTFKASFFFNHHIKLTLTVSILLLNTVQKNYLKGPCIFFNDVIT